MPGETDWYKSSLRHSKSEDEADEVAAQMQAHLSVSESAPRYAAPPSLASKYPFPTHPHTGALVKLYPSNAGDTSSPKTTEIVEFVGILDYAYFPSATTEETQASNGELVKTIHSIYRIPIAKKQGSAGILPGSQEWHSARSQLIGHMAKRMDGDRLAAEFLLLALYGHM